MTWLQDTWKGLFSKKSKKVSYRFHKRGDLEAMLHSEWLIHKNKQEGIVTLWKKKHLPTFKISVNTNNFSSKRKSILDFFEIIREENDTARLMNSPNYKYVVYKTFNDIEKTTSCCWNFLVRDKRLFITYEFPATSLDDTSNFETNDVESIITTIKLNFK